MTLDQQHDAWWRIELLKAKGFAIVKVGDASADSFMLRGPVDQYVASLEEAEAFVAGFREAAARKGVE